MAQVGEFSFILSKVGKDAGLLSSQSFQVFLAVSVLTMVVTPFLIDGSPRLMRRAEALKRLYHWARPDSVSDEEGAFIALAATAMHAVRRAELVFGEDVTKHGIDAALLGKVEMLIVSDILPNDTTRLAHYLLPGCAQAEKRGTFTNAKGRVQKFMKAIEPPGDARPEWEFLHELVFNVTGQDGFVSIEGLFNQMAREVPAFHGLTWAGLGDMGSQPTGAI